MEYFGTSLSVHGHYTWLIDDNKMTSTWLKLESLPFHPECLTNNLPKGEVIFYQGGGYTVIGIAGSCKDMRPGTKSIFWVKEIITREQMIEKIQQNKVAMQIIKAMPFKVRI